LSTLSLLGSKDPLSASLLFYEPVRTLYGCKSIPQCGRLVTLTKMNPSCFFLKHSLVDYCSTYKGRNFGALSPPPSPPPFLAPPPPPPPLIVSFWTWISCCLSEDLYGRCGSCYPEVLMCFSLLENMVCLSCVTTHYGLSGCLAFMFGDIHTFAPYMTGLGWS